MLLLILLLRGLELALALSSLQEHVYHNVAGRSITVPPKAASTAILLQQPDFTFDELYNLQRKFLDSFIYPNNAMQVGFPSYPTLNHPAEIPKLTAVMTGERD